MIWLQSNERYDELAAYNHTDGSYAQASRSLMGDDSPEYTDGIYSNLSSIFVAIYKFENQLYLRVNDDCIPMTEDIVISVHGELSNRRLMVLKEGRELTHVDYLLGDLNQIKGDPTPFVEKEDFDFGLFLSNISRSPERKRILLGLE